MHTQPHRALMAEWKGEEVKRARWRWPSAKKEIAVAAAEGMVMGNPSPPLPYSL